MGYLDKTSVFVQARTLDVKMADSELDLVTMYAALSLCEKAFVELEVTPPDWMTERKEEIKTEVKFRRVDAKIKELETLKTQVERLKSVEEKRSDVQSKIDELLQDPDIVALTKDD